MFVAEGFVRRRVSPLTFKLKLQSVWTEVVNECLPSKRFRVAGVAILPLY